MVDALIKYSRYPVPHALLVDVAETMDRYGRLQLANDPAHGLVLRALDRVVLIEVAKSKKLAGMLGAKLDDDTIAVHPSERGRLKQALLKLGWPAEDLAGYVDGEAHPIELAETGKDGGKPWTLRSYQREAVDSFWAGGSGVVVLPCGAGKTLVGAAAMAEAKATTLILVTNTVAGRQWKRELIARTSLTEEEIGEYSGERKEIRPVTIATYQVLTSRKKRRVHPPGPVRRPRLGPGRLRRGAPAARADLPLHRGPPGPPPARPDRHPGPRGRPGGRRVQPDRPEAVRRALEGHRVAGLDRPGRVHRGTRHADRRRADGVRDGGDRGALPDGRHRPHQAAGGAGPGGAAPGRADAGHRRRTSTSCTSSANTWTRPIVQGSTTNKERERLFDAFRSGSLRTLVISKVGNFSIDLPEAAVAIQVSGTFGSRQEEAQRLGRVLRPKADGRQAHFYTVVSRDTIDTEYAAHRQRFLAEQGYAYTIVDADDVLGPSLPSFD